ncbi:unnamed protein product [Trichobilharzia szidati]|nr:unnamed protein product [Trichobilharzia szidati]
MVKQKPPTNFAQVVPLRNLLQPHLIAMEFFLKRVPAFSRALGDFDSDSDDDADNDIEPTHEELTVSFSNEKNEELNVNQL